MARTFKQSEAMVALQQVSYGAQVLEMMDKNVLYKVSLKNVDTGKNEPASEVIESIAKCLNNLAFRMRLHERAMKTDD